MSRASASPTRRGPAAPNRAAPGLVPRCLGLCALLLLGAGCRDGAAPAPGPTPASGAATPPPPAAGGSEATGSTTHAALVSAGAPATSGPATGPATVTGPGARWQRTRAAEPDPAARALYRRALDLLAAGQAVQAAPVLAQLRRDHPQSRFGARLDAPDARFGAALGALVAAGAGLATASGLMRARAAGTTPPAAAAPPPTGPKAPAGP